MASVSMVEEIEPPPIIPSDGMPVTPEEYERVVENGHKYELVDGRLHEVEVSAYSQLVASKINSRIEHFLADHDCGYVLCDGRFRFYPDEPTRVRRPDAAFVSFERLGGREFPASNIDAAPELAVEAVSPSDTVWRLQRKIAEYLRHGVLEVWVAHPVPQAIDVHRPGGSLTRHGAGDTLPIDHGPLAGFRLRVADVFPPQRDFPPSPDDD